MSEVVQELVEKISNLTLMEAAELKKELEEKFGVTAAAPMMMAGGPMPAAGAGSEEEEQTEFNVELIEAGDKKLNVIKAIREITGLGLKEAKDAAENLPSVIKEAVSKDEAEDVKKKLEEAGAKVSLK